MSLFRKPLSGQRFSGGSLINGKWIEGAATPISFDASVQPTIPHDLFYLPEGRREKKTYTIYTDTKLQALTIGTKNPDQVYIDGEVYEVATEAPWRNNVISHYKYLVVLINAIEG